MAEFIQKPLTLGWISYLNLYPLLYELRKNLGEFFELSQGTPAFVNQLLREKKVDLAPSSSICLLRDKPLESLPMGVVSKGKVHSVYLGFQKNNENLYFLLKERAGALKASLEVSSRLSLDSLSEKILSFSSAYTALKGLPPIHFTSESQTSVELAKIFLVSLLGEGNYSVIRDRPEQEGEVVEVLIGDQALRRRKSFSHLLDLGELWKDITGFPFVYAVWQGNKVISSPLRGKLLSLASYTEKKMHESASFYVDEYHRAGGKDFCPISLGEYWASLFYTVDDHSKKGLDLFLSLVKLRERCGPSTLLSN